ncbi:MAG: hypothetical protein V1790_17485 [Planctomycetota bacterium]
MKILKQSTAAVISFGPFLDKTDGVTLEVGAGIITSIDHATTGIFLSKNGGAGAIRHQTVTASVLDAYGMFLVTLDTTDTNTVGRLRVMMAEAATFLPVWDDYFVLPANVYDSLVGTDLLDINVAQLLGTAWLTPGTAGTPDVNAKLIGALAVPSGAIPAAVAGAAGGVFIAGANAATSITTALTANITGNVTGNLSGSVGSVPAVTLANGTHGGAATVITLQTPIAATVPDAQKVDVNTIKTQAVTCAAGVTVLASVGTAAASTTQTGDVAALITTVGVAGAGLTALGDARLANLNAPVATVDTVVDGIATTLGAAGAGLTALGDARMANLDATVSTRATPAQVNTEVVDALATDVIAETAQGIPTATPTIKQAVMLPYMALRNKLTVTATEKAIYNDAGTKIAKKALADDGTVYTEDEMISGA